MGQTFCTALLVCAATGPLLLALGVLGLAVDSLTEAQAEKLLKLIKCKETEMKIKCKTAKRYIKLCELYGWRPTWEGLFAFAVQEPLRERWRSGR